jgi:hypothetical protein
MATNGTSTASSNRIETTAVLVNRIKTDYMELPGLSLTPWQAQRLWGLDEVQCEAILKALVDAAFLRRTRNGCYARID